ncbi:MAG: ribonuclease E/G [Stellaceae bacterium]
MTRLLVQVSPGELWAALTVDEDVEALRLVRTLGAPGRGDLYLGRVVALRPELPAALVDIGAGRPAFLDVAALPREGEAIIVKVVRSARADKAATLTTKLDAADEARAKSTSTGSPPLLLHRRDTALIALLREFGAGAAEIILDDAAALADARAWLARHRAEATATLHRDTLPLFEAHGIADRVAAALQQRVALPAGGAITIEPTAAAILIDVDGGKAGAMDANLAAVIEIARQIRLRDLAGPIVVDFIGMADRGRRTRLEAAIAASLAELEVELLGWTRLGHFELVRPRRRPSLMELLFERPAGGCLIKTPLTVALEAMRQVQRDSHATPAARFILRVPPEVAAALEGEAAAALRELETRLGHRLALHADTHQSRERFVVEHAPIRAD